MELFCPLLNAVTDSNAAAQNTHPHNFHVVAAAIFGTNFIAKLDKSIIRAHKICSTALAHSHGAAARATTVKCISLGSLAMNS